MGLFDGVLDLGKGDSPKVKASQPRWQADTAAETSDRARLLSSQPKPTYDGPRIAPMSSEQQRATDLANKQTGNWRSDVNAARRTTKDALNTPIPTANVGVSNIGNRSIGMPNQISQQTAGMPIQIGNHSTGLAPTIGDHRTAMPGQIGNFRMDDPRAIGTFAADDPRMIGQYQMGQPGQIDDFGVEQGARYADADLDAYMNPYVEQVLDRGLNDLERQWLRAQQQVKANQAMTGAFGGGRHAVQSSLNDEAFARLMGDFGAQHRANAFESGAAAFERERAVDYQREAANAARAQWANASNVGNRMNVDQFNTGLSADLDARNVANLMQTNQFNTGLGADIARQDVANSMASSQFNTGLGADLAARNVANEMQARQFNSGLGMQRDAQNSANWLNASQFDANLGMQSDAQNAQNRMATEQFNIGNRLATDQQNVANSMNAQKYNSNLGTQVAMQDRANSLSSQQYNAGLNSENARFSGNLGLAAADRMAGLGGTAQDYGAQDMRNLMGVGAANQGYDQANLDLAYQDFQEQKAWPYEQLNYLTAINSGQPQPSYAMEPAQPNAWGQVAGTTAALAPFLMQ